MNFDSTTTSTITFEYTRSQPHFPTQSEVFLIKKQKQEIQLKNTVYVKSEDLKCVHFDLTNLENEKIVEIVTSLYILNKNGVRQTIQYSRTLGLKPQERKNVGKMDFKDFKVKTCASRRLLQNET